VADLGRVVLNWLRTRPWFAAVTDSEVVTLVPDQLTPLNDAWPMLVWAPVMVRLDTGVELTCQLFLGLHPASTATADVDSIGTIGAGADAFVVTDALEDPRLCAEIVRSCAPDLRVRRTEHVEGGASASHILIDGRHRLSVFRWLERGPNPDVEIPVGIGRVDLDGAVPRPIHVWIREGWELGTVAPYRPAVSMGESVSTSLDEVLGDRVPPHRCDVDIATSSFAAGVALAKFHVASAEAFGARPLEGSRLSVALDANAEVLEASGLGAAGLRAAAARVACAVDLGSAIRTHGSIRPASFSVRSGRAAIGHFQGDPLVPLDQRRAETSPLRDVSSLLSSLSELASARIPADLDDTQGLALEATELLRLAEAWLERAETHVLAGYREVEPAGELLPGAPASRDALVRFFELERSVEQLVSGRGSEQPLVDLADATVRVSPEPQTTRK
jgi:predicted trehalose synthase